MRLMVPALAASLALAACTAQPPAYPVPPPLPPEVMPLPPVSDQPLLYQPGDWAFVDGSYRYEPGRYVPRGAHGAGWIPGHWVGAQGQYMWVPGGWN